MLNSPNYYKLFLGGRYRELVRTCTGRWFDVTDCPILMDNELPDRDGVIPNARPLSNEQVVDLLVKAAKAKRKRKVGVRGPDKNPFKRMGLETVLKVISMFESGEVEEAV